MRRRETHILLNELSVFELAARHGSFSEAARELGITQSAVSHQVGRLERELGTVLFERVWRGVTLTEAGRVLSDSVRASLDLLSLGVDAARSLGNGQRITVVTDFGFAAYWLLPHLDALKEVLPEIEVRITTTQSSANVDFSAGDLVIAFGVEAPAGWESVRLIDETVVPVANPVLAERLARGELARVPRLHLSLPETPPPRNAAPAASNERWMGWPSYLAGQATTSTGGAWESAGPDLTFSNYPLVIQAAMAGQGVALGWRPLVDTLLNQGLLVPVLPERTTPSRGYDLLLPPFRGGRSHVHALKDWLVGQFSASRRQKNEEDETA
ncbi:transcriptional regulator, LysR family [Faunimonas pinastri]|uniref:Transcriptional regulator, LysR family n=1 Tax=Faunimonas pinastri TaxID=1855383 RepID=A0A1H9HYA2_9HYPH|nr:LysR family transcriptional regulator [Faunimonas pinastri]SEQ67152.1 transcriptional regulator, LysR family [Faunimonas pinastri]